MQTSNILIGFLISDSHSSNDEFKMLTLQITPYAGSKLQSISEIFSLVDGESKGWYFNRDLDFLIELPLTLSQALNKHPVTGALVFKTTNEDIVDNLYAAEDKMQFLRNMYWDDSESLLYCSDKSLLVKSLKK